MSNQTKYGFTLVEMATVLLVIGILMTIAVKGKYLITTAKIKHDIKVINEYRVFGIKYLAENNFTLPVNNGQNYPESFMGKSNNPFLLTSIVNAVFFQHATDKNTYFAGSSSAPKIAMVLVSGTKANSQFNLGCLYDSVVDDGNPNTGMIKFWGNDFSSPNRVFLGDDCDNASLLSGNNFNSYSFFIN